MLKFAFVFLLNNVLGSAFCDGFTHWHSAEPQPSDYYVREGMAVTDDSIAGENVQVQNFKDCIDKCPLTGSSCKYMTVNVMVDGQVECNIYATDLSASKLSAAEVFYPNRFFLVTKQELPCSGFCKRFKGKLCDKGCFCMEGCNEGVMPFWCECRRHDVPIQKDCLGYQKTGYDKSGMFFIDPDESGENINVFCEMKSNSAAEITMMRRFLPGVQQNINSHYHTGFGQFYASLYAMLSLKEVHRITSVYPHSMLWMTAVDLYGQTYTGHWEHFFVDDFSTTFRLTVAGYQDHASGMPDLFDKRDGKRFVGKAHRSSTKFWKHPETFRSPCMVGGIAIQNRDLSRITLTIDTSEKWELAAEEVCFDAMQDTSSATFKVPFDGLLSGVKLLHKTGKVNCWTSNAYDTNYGCGVIGNDHLTPNQVGVWITSEAKDITYFPKDDHVMGFYTLPGYHSDSSVVILRDTKTPVRMSQDNVLKIVYGEVLHGEDLGNNRGTSCSKVYVQMKYD